ncbi:MAG: BA14K family protein [Pseudorhodoplanes sp.]|nr:BA14K family protein [Pseudorhodoplanes sp.]
MYDSPTCRIGGRDMQSRNWLSKLTAGAAALAVFAAVALTAVPADARNRTGAFLGGLAAGAIIGGALMAPGAPVYAAPPPPVYVAPGPAYDDAVAYCMRRFRSYNPHTGTYMGYDGIERPCP